MLHTEVAWCLIFKVLQTLHNRWIGSSCVIIKSKEVVIVTECWCSAPGCAAAELDRLSLSSAALARYCWPTRATQSGDTHRSLEVRMCFMCNRCRNIFTHSRSKTNVHQNASADSAYVQLYSRSTMSVRAQHTGQLLPIPDKVFAHESQTWHVHTA